MVGQVAQGQGCQTRCARVELAQANIIVTAVNANPLTRVKKVWLKQHLPKRLAGAAKRCGLRMWRRGGARRGGRHYASSDTVVTSVIH